jgi:5,6,7,8-tetrahydromethanopterin hydro-lyase
LTWGGAQAGVAAGVGLAHQQSLFDGDIDSLVLIVAVWVNPSADNEEEVFSNNRDATVAALKQARDAGPDLNQALVAMTNPSNPYFRTA